jgi:ABC-type multidrug transport system fused ATPase/permease subunit
VPLAPFIRQLIFRKQVCLARVLLKQPKVLCLDEATASLDAKTEALFQKVLEENFADATILCIAHRTDTLKWCRTRIVMQEGRVLRIEGNNVVEHQKMLA